MNNDSPPARPDTLRATGPGRWETDDGRWIVTTDDFGLIATDFVGRQSFWSNDGLDGVQRRITRLTRCRKA